MGTLTDAGLLVFGLILGWFMYRRPLSSAWSRVGPAVAPQLAYREGPAAVPIAGASRFVRFLVAYVLTLGLFGAARVVWAWVGMQDIYDRGHEVNDLVPLDARGIVLQFAIGVQGALMLVVMPRAARAFAYRREPRAGVALVVVGIGVLVAATDYVVLRSAPRTIYWLQQMLLDDAVFGVLTLFGFAALLLLRRVETRSPPVVEAAITKATRVEVNRARAFEVAVAVLSIVTMGHAFAYARDHYRVDREIDGEIEVSTGDGEPVHSKDGSFMYWMPKDTSIYPPRDKDTPYGKVQATWYYFTSHELQLSLEYWERPANDIRTLAEMCPPPGVMRMESTCDVTLENRLKRTVLAGNRIYELHAYGLEKPAAQLFLHSFRVLPPEK